MINLKKKDNPSGEKSALLLEQGKVEDYLKKVKDWNLLSGGKKISRNFEFKSFREAVDFVNGVASFATKINHYPDSMTIRHKKVTIELMTGEIGGLSENDFILAEEANAIGGWKKDLEQWIISPKVLIPLIIIALSAILWQYLF